MIQKVGFLPFLKLKNAQEHRTSRKILRLLAQDFIMIFFLVLLICIFLFLFSSSFNELLMSHDWKKVMLRNACRIPQLSKRLLSLCMLVSAFWLLAQRSRSLELVVLESIGIGRFSLYRFLMGLCFVISSLSFFFILQFLEPMAEKKILELEPPNKKSNAPWWVNTPYLIQYSFWNSEEKALINPSIYRMDQSRIQESWVGKKALFANLKPTVFKVEIQEGIYRRNSEKPLVSSFEKIDLMMNLPSLKVLDQSEAPEQIALIQKLKLFWFLPKTDFKNPIFQDLGQNLGFYFSCFSLLLIAFAFTSINPREIKPLNQMGLCLAIAIVYWVVYNALSSLAQTGEYNPISLQTFLLGATILLSVLKYLYRDEL